MWTSIKLLSQTQQKPDFSLMLLQYLGYHYRDSSDTGFCWEERFWFFFCFFFTKTRVHIASWKQRNVSQIQFSLLQSFLIPASNSYSFRRTRELLHSELHRKRLSHSLSCIEWTREDEYSGSFGKAPLGAGVCVCWCVHRKINVWSYSSAVWDQSKVCRYSCVLANIKEVKNMLYMVDNVWHAVNIFTTI